MNTTKHDIQERTFEFGARTVHLVNRMPRTIAGNAIGQQLIRSGTAVGANMEEAEAAESKNDFIHKTGIALKEAREALYWLRLVATTLLPNDDEVKKLTQEALEISLILGAIKRNAIQNRASHPKPLP